MEAENQEKQQFLPDLHPKKDKKKKKKKKKDKKEKKEEDPYSATGKSKMPPINSP